MSAQRAHDLTQLLHQLAHITGEACLPSLTTPSQLSACIQSLHDSNKKTISGLEEINAELNHIHNAAFSPTSQLPTELLTMILAYLFVPDPDSTDVSFYKAMRTCRQWHNAACAARCFWTIIRINYPAQTRAALNRSGTLPLTLHMDPAPNVSIQGVAAMLQPHFHRVKSVHVKETDKDASLLQSFFQNLDIPADNLKYLRIKLNSPLSSRLIYIPSVFTNSFPSLRTLHLDYAHFPTTVLPQLEELSIHNALPSLTAMLDLLERCPRLRTLTVDDYIPYHHLAPMVTGRKVNLSHLEYLHVRTAPVAEVTNFLVCLRIPDTAKMCVDLDRETDTTVGWDFPNLSTFPDLPCTTGIRRVKLGWEEPTTVYIRAWRTSSSSDSDSDWDAQLAPDLELIMRGVEDGIEDVPTDWPFDVSQVETCVMESSEAEYEGLPCAWEMFHDLAALKRFKLVGADEGIVEYALKSLRERYVPEGKTVPVLRYCEKLEKLEISGFFWVDDIERALRKLVAWRQAVGVLREIVLRDVVDPPEEFEVEQVQKDRPPVLVRFL